MIFSSTIAPLLSNVTFDQASGLVNGAVGVLNAWLLKFEDSSEYGEAANDPIIYDWEEGFIEVVAGDAKPEGQPAETDFYAIAGRSYDDEIMATLASNLSILLIDTVLILFYVIVVLGRFNVVEQRVSSPRRFLVNFSYDRSHYSRYFCP